MADIVEAFKAALMGVTLGNRSRPIAAFTTDVQRTLTRYTERTRNRAEARELRAIADRAIARATRLAGVRAFEAGD